MSNSQHPDQGVDVAEAETLIELDAEVLEQVVGGLIVASGQSIE